jgi:predicted transcriptional regulator
MLLREVLELLAGNVIWGVEFLDHLEVRACFAADLMSDVLAFSRPGVLLITGLVSIQSAHTADVADLPAILYVSGKRPAEAVIFLAREQGIPLLTTPLSMFEACGRLHAGGLLPGVRS